MSRMVKVVRTVAEEGVRSSFSSVAYTHTYSGIEKRQTIRLKVRVTLTEKKKNDTAKKKVFF